MERIRWDRGEALEEEGQELDRAVEGHGLRRLAPKVQPKAALAVPLGGAGAVEKLRGVGLVARHWVIPHRARPQRAVIPALLLLFVVVVVIERKSFVIMFCCLRWCCRRVHDDDDGIPRVWGETTTTAKFKKSGCKQGQKRDE